MEQHETLRHAIIALLGKERLTAKEISEQIGIGEKDVFDHLAQIRLHKRDQRLVVSPAVCHRCGFVFRKRDRLKKPGRCPVCRGEYMEQPSFSIQRRSAHPDSG